MYIAPIIEWYLPVICDKPIHENASRNKIESFQHRMLCLVTGASQRVPSKGLDEIMAEPPVHFKLRKFADRMCQYFHRDRDEMRGEQAPGRTTRSGRSSHVTCVWRGADKRDFGDRLFVLSEEHRSTPKDTKRLYNRQSSKRLVFCASKAKLWVKSANADVKRRAARREAGFEDFYN